MSDVMMERCLISHDPFLCMVSTPYYRGRSREYQVMRRLRSEGWLCSRSAASHGPVDIFAAKEGEVVLIQVKSGKGRLSPAERETLRSWAQAYQARAEVWFFKKRTTEKLLILDAKKSNMPESSS
ncbi:MAG: hypothetical protein V1857_00660 [archaeon]